MHFHVILAAIIGVSLLIFLAAVPTASKPMLNKAEPALVVFSLLAIFWALQSAVFGGAEAQRSPSPNSILSDFQFSQKCKNRLGGVATFTKNKSYCRGGGFEADNIKVSR